MNQKLQSEEYIRYKLCKEFGWDFNTYENQPPFFIEELIVFMNQEYLNEKNQSKIGSTPRPSGMGIKR